MNDCITTKSLVSALIILCAFIFSCLPFMGSWEWLTSLFQRGDLILQKLMYVRTFSQPLSRFQSVSKIKGREREREMSSQLQSWIQSAKLSKYENILIEEIGEMDVVGMLTEDDVKEIAKKCGMNIGKRRLFLTAVQKVKNETRKNETTIPVQVRKIDTKRVQDVIREITLKYEFEALNLLGFARKLIKALIKHPNQRLKLTEKKYESEIVVPGLEVLLVNIVGLMKLKRGDGHIYLSIVDPEVDDRSTLKITSGVEKPLSQVRNVMDIEIEKLKFVSHAFEQRTSSTETEMAREGVRKMLREKLEALQKTIREEKLRAASPDVQTSREWKIVPPLTPHRLHLLKQVSDTSEDNMADFIEQSAKERVEAGLQTRVSQDEPTKTTNTTSTTFSTSHSRKVENLEQGKKRFRFNTSYPSSGKFDVNLIILNLHKMCMNISRNGYLMSAAKRNVRSNLCRGERHRNLWQII